MVTLQMEGQLCKSTERLVNGSSTKDSSAQKISLMEEARPFVEEVVDEGVEDVRKRGGCREGGC